MPELPFSQVMRLIWIDAKLASTLRINRADLCTTFGISVAQAAADLRVFQSAFPDRMTYDRSGKFYVRVKDSSPVYPTEPRYSVHRAASAVQEIMRRSVAANA